MFKSVLKFLLILGGIVPAVVFCQPKFHLIGETKFDFGDVPNFMPANRIITIKNIGTQTLILTDVGGTCGCTATLLSSDHIAPNDSGTLSITFDAKRFDGRVEKKVVMRTNDADKPRVELTFTANVVKVLELEPEYLFFRSTADSTASETLTIKNVSAKKIKILSVSQNSDIASSLLSNDVIKPGESVTLKGFFKSKTSGTFNGNYDIRTDHPTLPRFTVRFFGWVK